jgi:hypothetical protein
MPPTCRDLAEPNEPIYAENNGEPRELWWLGPYLLYNVITHTDIAVLIDVDKKMETAGEDVSSTYVTLDPLGVHETDGFVAELSMGEGFFAALHGTMDSGMPFVDVWCAPQPTSNFDLTKLSAHQGPGPLINLRQADPDYSAKAIRACGNRFAVLDAGGAVGLWSVDLEAGSVTKLASSHP